MKSNLVEFINRVLERKERERGKRKKERVSNEAFSRKTSITRARKIEREKRKRERKSVFELQFLNIDFNSLSAFCVLTSVY